MIGYGIPLRQSATKESRGRPVRIRDIFPDNKPGCPDTKLIKEICQPWRSILVNGAGVCWRVGQPITMFHRPELIHVDVDVERRNGGRGGQRFPSLETEEVPGVSA
jgi:hypothetical protein